MAGETATATIELRFDKPLPDDRYTLTLSDSIRDISGNDLDGESNASEPHGVFHLPGGASGDGVSGGDFAARFTVDSRPEIGVYGNNAAWIDINGNGSLDPTGEDNDRVNRDLAFVFGGFSDQLIAGDFTPADGLTPASGFDKLGAYGNGQDVQGPARWLLDFDGDGTPDFEVVDQVGGSGTPVAGDFDPSHPGDEIGLFISKKWRLDTDGDHVLESSDRLINGSLQGAPIVGDFDGDGLDDLATYKDGVFSFDLAANGLNGDVEATIEFGFFGPFEFPVAADMNLDGVDDIGLFVPERSGVVPSEVARWYFLVSTGDPVAGTLNALDHHFTPVPFGNDLSFQFGDELSKPIVGNFDPPVVESSPLSSNAIPPITHYDQSDVDRNGRITLHDLLLVVRELRDRGIREASSPTDLVFDTTSDHWITMNDMLTIVRRLRAMPQGNEGEGEPGVSRAASESHDAVFQDFSAETLLVGEDSLAESPEEQDERENVFDPLDSVL